MTVIGITGGSGSGKTTLLSAIGRRKGLVLDCDAIYHELLKTDPELLTAIEARFPGTVEDGALNREKLGRIVFGDGDALLALNRITHGAVVREVKARLAASEADLAAIDAIGLFESGLDSLCHTTVCVTAPLEDRVRRLMLRDGISEERARARLAAQKSDEALSALCRHTLCNDRDYPQFLQQCEALLAKILNSHSAL